MNAPRRAAPLSQAPRRSCASRCAICAAVSRACGFSSSASRSASRRSSRVNSLAHALEDGLARDGRVILGGDASFSLIHRELSPEERAFLERRGNYRPSPRCARWRATSAGDAALVEVKAVEPSAGRWLGAASFDPALGAGRRRSRKGRRVRRGGRRGAARPAGPRRSAIAFDLGDGALRRFAPRSSSRTRPARGRRRLRAARADFAGRAGAPAASSSPASLVRWTTRVRHGRAAAAERGRRQRLPRRGEAEPSPRPAGRRARASNVSPDFSRNIDRFAEFLALVGLTVAGRRRRRRRQRGARLRRAQARDAGDPEGDRGERRRGRRARRGRVPGRRARRRAVGRGAGRGDCRSRSTAVRRPIICRSRSSRSVTRGTSRSASPTVC